MFPTLKMCSSWMILLMVGVLFPLYSYVQSEEFAHEYIQELYRTHFDENGTKKMQEEHIPGIVHSYIGEVDEKSNVVHFNLSDGHADEFILKAEIRLKLPKNTFEWPLGLILHDVTNQKQASVALDSSRQWAVFSVRSMVKRWLRLPHTNLGVQLMVKNSKTGRVEPPKTVIGEAANESRHPLLELVIFADYKPLQLNERSTKRARRNSVNKPAAQNQTSTCSKRDMHVNVTEKFGEYVIAPAWYNAYTCEGSCPEHALREQSSSKNQKLVNHDHVMKQFVRHDSLAEFRCVPSNYKGLSMLYIDAKGNVVLQHFPDMIIGECECSYSVDCKRVIVSYD